MGQEGNTHTRAISANALMAQGLEKMMSEPSKTPEKTPESQTPPVVTTDAASVAVDPRALASPKAEARRLEVEANTKRLMAMAEEQAKHEVMHEVEALELQVSGLLRILEFKKSDAYLQAKIKANAPKSDPGDVLRAGIATLQTVAAASNPFDQLARRLGQMQQTSVDPEKLAATVAKMDKA